MNNCKDCLKPLEQVGTRTAASFPEGPWCGLKWARNTLLKCPQCEGLTLLVEIIDVYGSTLDWHYLKLPVNIEHRREKGVRR